MSILSCNPTPPSPPARTTTLQKYLILHAQHDSLQKHLQELSAASTTASNESSASSSLSTSPTSSQPMHHFRRNNHHHHSASISGPRPASLSTSPTTYTLMPPSPSTFSPSSASGRPTTLLSRRSSYPPHESTTLTAESKRQLSEVEMEELKLANVNRLIKGVLVELLNGSETERLSEEERMWVLQRLMDCEGEIRGGRKRVRGGSFGAGSE